MTISDTRRFVYHVDRDNTIIRVNADWIAFAQENAAAHLDDTTVIGQSLLDYVTDRETRHLYALLLQKVRNAQASITLPFRCDSPSLRRYMELTLVPHINAGVEFDAQLIRIEPRPPMALLDPTQQRSEDFVVICSWCKRIRTPAGWCEVEVAVRRLRLFDTAKLPALSHGICPSCQQMVRRELAQYAA